MFISSHRPDGFVVPSCDSCQNASRDSDSVAATVSRWGFDDQDDLLQDHRKLVRGIANNRPEIHEEWTKLSLIQRKRARKHLESRGVFGNGNNIVAIDKNSIAELNRFAKKFIVAAHYSILGKPIPLQGAIWCQWRTKEHVISSGFPESLLRLTGPVHSLKLGNWDTAEQFQYRFAPNLPEGEFGIIARFQVNLFIWGFAVWNADNISASDKIGWAPLSDIFK